MFLSSYRKGFTLGCGCLEQSHGDFPLYPPIMEVLCLSSAPVVNRDGKIGGNLRVNANLQSGKKDKDALDTTESNLMRKASNCTASRKSVICSSHTRPGYHKR
jgi:hypothetical protein